MSGATKDGKKTRFVYTARWVPEKEASGQAYMSLTAWVLPQLSLGADLRPLDRKLAPMGNWRAVAEDPDGWRPTVIMGYSNDDFTVSGEEESSSVVSAVLAKHLYRLEALQLDFAPYAGAAWIEVLDEVRVIGGLNIRHPEASLMLQYSGTDTHMTLTRQIDSQLSLSAIYWGLRYPGLGLRYSF